MMMPTMDFQTMRARAMSDEPAGQSPKADGCRTSLWKSVTSKLLCIVQPLLDFRTMSDALTLPTDCSRLQCLYICWIRDSGHDLYRHNIPRNLQWPKDTLLILRHRCISNSSEQCFSTMPQSPTHREVRISLPVESPT